VQLWEQPVLPIAWLREADKYQQLEVLLLRTEEIKPQCKYILFNPQSIILTSLANQLFQI
jgi:hypothetical protein